MYTAILFTGSEKIQIVIHWRKREWIEAIINITTLLLRSSYTFSGNVNR